MSSVKEQPIGKCCVCSEGWVIVVKEVFDIGWSKYIDQTMLQ